MRNDLISSAKCLRQTQAGDQVPGLEVVAVVEAEDKEVEAALPLRVRLTLLITSLSIGTPVMSTTR